MLIELQITATSYLCLLREQLRLRPLSVTDEVRDEQGRLMVVNRVLIGRDAQVRGGDQTTVPVSAGFAGAVASSGIVARPVRVVQPVTVELAYLDDLAQYGDRPAPVHVLPLFVILDVTLTAQDGDAVLAVVPSGVEGLPPAAAMASLGVALCAAIRLEPLPLDLTEDALADLPVVSAGISYKPPATPDDAGNVALRVEVGERESTESEWQAFLDGSYTDLLELSEGPDQRVPLRAERWAVFVDRGLLERYARRIIQDAFVASQALKTSSDIDVRWANPDAAPCLLARFKTVAIDGCDLGSLGVQDLRLDVQVPVRLSVPADNVLRLHLKVHSRPDDLDVGACTATAAMLQPLIVTREVSTASLSWDTFMWRVILRPAWRLAAAVAAADEASLPPRPGVAQPSPDECQRDQAVTVGGAPGVGCLELWSCRGLPTGLLLTGRQAPRPETRAALIRASHSGLVFREPEIPCSRVAAAGASVTGSVYAAAECMVETVGDPAGEAGAPTIPFQKWQHRFLEEALADELEFETIEDLYIDGLMLMLRGKLPGPSARAHPRPVRLLLKTNGGARVFTFGAIAPLDGAREADLVAAGVAKAVADCQPSIEPWWSQVRRFELPWRAGSPPVRFLSAGDRRLWIVSFVGLAPLDGMSAALGEQTVQSVRANRRGQAALAVLQPAGLEAALSLTYAPAPGAVARAGQGRMMVTQVTLTEVGRCRLADCIQGLEVVWQRSARRLYATHEDGFSVIDVSIPARPRVRGVRRGEHLRGALLDGEGLLLLHRERRRFDPLRARLTAELSGVEESPVVRTLAGAGGFYVVRRHSVDVFDRSLVRLGSRPLDRPTAGAVLVGDRLIVGGPHGLATLGLGRSWKRSVAERFDIGAVEHLWAETPVVPRGSVLARRGGRTALFDLPARESDAREATLLAEYEEVPWFARCATFDSYVVFALGDEVSINAIVGRTAQDRPTG